MPQGGARTKSGPPIDPNSARSDQRGIKMTALPASGYDGDVPDLTDFLPAATDRHAQIWAQLWAHPQACMWVRQPWLISIVADLVRCQVRSEEPDAPAAWETPVQQKRTELGLTPSGMRFLGWKIAEDQLAERRAEKVEKEPTVAPERRLRSTDAQS